jgi:hypothetical protein
MRQEAAIADGLLTVSMYGSWDAFRTGWKRIFIESCVRNPRRLSEQAMHLAAFAVAMPAASALSGALAGAALAFGGADVDEGARSLAWAAVAASAAAFAWRSGVLVAVYALSGFPSWAGPLFPLASIPVVRAFLQGAADLRRRVPVRWGGREYVLEPTDR